MNEGPATAAIAAVLQRMGGAGEDPLLLVRDLVAALRARRRADAVDNWRALLKLLAADAGARRALAAVCFACFAGRRQRSFYTEAGLLPNSGFYSELRQKLAYKLLPETIDADNFQDVLRVIFPSGRDLAWLQSIAPEERHALWTLLAQEPVGSAPEQAAIRAQLLDGTLVIAHRLAAMGLEPELQRALPRLGRGESPFVALCDEITALAAPGRAAAGGTRVSAAELDHLEVLLAQCRETVERVHQAALSRGTSLSLTFLVVRLRQHLQRLDRLLGLLVADRGATAPQERWCTFLFGGIEAELQHRSLRRHVDDLTALLALRVTENAGRTGEHYIARNPEEWRGMRRAAAGAGFLIALMALTKIEGTALHLALLNHGLLNGLIYAAGFAVIHLCHGTVATKQPAMTAATIAATISRTRGGRLREVERLAELAVATARSQFAAIAGNVLVAFPLAVGLTLAFQSATGGTLLPEAKSFDLLRQLNPLSGVFFYAGIAGIWLFVSGLVSGYVDNQAAYSRLGERVAAHPWLQRFPGKARAARLGRYLDHNAGGLAGNIFFGMMLGLTPFFGAITGLPIDIRHIAFAAANFGYAYASLGFQLSLGEILRAVAGVALIGTINLAVSFALALGLALRSRGVDFSAAAALLPELWRRLRANPSRFFFPVEKRVGVQE